ncbi:hypothetical protein D3C72_1463080 [compost metagenome]
MPGVSNLTRNAMPSSCASDAMLPTVISSESPVFPAFGLGTPHSGDMRGKSTNRASVSGAPMAIIFSDRPAAYLSEGWPTGMCALTKAVSRPTRPIAMARAVSSDCECRKLASSAKKPRKNTTMASRRARISRVLSASSMLMRVTPASEPTMVL